MNRRYTSVVASTLAALASGAPASAQSVHTVQPGDTLWSIAAANNFTTRALAAANGMSQDGLVLVGQSIRIPSETEALGPPTGAYMVQPGDTLSEIALRNGVGLDQIASTNGLDPAGALIAGTTLELPTGAYPTEAEHTPPTHGPEPTTETVSPSLVQQIAVQHGVSPSLAAAIAHQESGFSNAFVSSADARGVMQITPAAWQFVQSNLAPYPLEPASAHDNVQAGVVYLGRLLRDTGDEVTATAAYYQGLSSVRTIGLLPETQTYIDSVMALRSRYGG